MKKTILTVLIYCGIIGTPWNDLRAQASTENTRLFRFYEDNDFINLNGNGTDQAYTNGTRFDLFYTRPQPPRSFPDRWMPKAGKESINTYGWGFMQVMFTPRDLRKVVPVPGDFAYAGGLFITHTIHSTNPVRKFNLQTEWFAGVMGPWALAKETQTIAHRILGFTRPRGWRNQIGNKVLLNLNLTAEKQVAAYKKIAEVTAGGQLYAGTMLNGFAAYSLIRIGKMLPYYNGYITQYANTKHWQLYAIIRPGVELMFTNALVKGVAPVESPGQPPLPGNRPTYANNKLLAGIDCGLVAVFGKAGFSLTQKTMSPVINGISHHEVGNISFYLAW
ncbi:lipid A 3-O-deacylase [Chitinophaga sp. W3I9]|uniref:lipid A-modifier LpxR family protein n=1 Tax=unclassified Chitinophaga TaxID=2619133 RepID=UPI003D226042